jgi:Ala-tRNA(Pro) deacylase
MDIKAFLRERKVAFEVLPHPHSEGAAQLAHAVHVSGSQVAKSVLLHANHSFKDVVAVIPADRYVDAASVSRMFGGAEIRFANEEDIAIHCPDCERGVLPPFGSQYNMRTVVDESLANKTYIVIEGNSHDEALRIKWKDFSHLESPLVGSIAVSEPWEVARTNDVDATVRSNDV